MDIDLVKKWIEEELSRGNSEPYKKLRSFCNKIYRHLNKDKVALYNCEYYKKIKKHTENNKEDVFGIKKHTEIMNKDKEDIKKHTEKDMNKISKMGSIF